VMDVVSVGECMVEMFCDGRISDAVQFTRAYGGDVLNTIVAASRLGSDVGFITRVGHDPFASFLLSSWREEGIDLACARLVPGFNGIYFISLLENGKTEFTYYRPGSAASTLSADDIDPGYIQRTKILHTSGITQAISRSAREAALRALQVARESGVTTSFDPNLRLKLTTLDEAKEALAETLPLTDIFLPSCPDETSSLFEGMQLEEIVRFVAAQGVKMVAIKCGAEGCLIASDGHLQRLKLGFSPTVVDTTGAGDAFNGGFLHGIAHGHGPAEAAMIGMAVAALKVRGRGAVHSMPTRAEVAELLSSFGISLA